MLDAKKIIFICFLLIFTGCRSNISPKEEIGLQIPLAPIMIGYDSVVYAKALKQEPSDLTNSIYDSSISKAMFFKRVLFDSGKDNQFENDIGVTQINSLCVMGKFILSDKYKNEANLQGEVYNEFYDWLGNKQKKWEKIVLNEDPRVFDLPCQNVK